MPKKKSQRSLTAWTKQKWRTRSGKPSTQGPKQPGSDIYRKRPLRHSPRRSTLLRLAQSAKAKKAGKQVSKQPKKIAKKTRAYRKVR